MMWWPLSIGYKSCRVCGSYAIPIWFQVTHKSCTVYGSWVSWGSHSLLLFKFIGEYWSSPSYSFSMLYAFCSDLVWNYFYLLMNYKLPKVFF